MKKIIKLTESELLSLIERLIYENDPKLGTRKKLKKETQEMKEGELTEKCWPGYTQKGMKTMFGKRYPNCVKKTVKESLDEADINWKKEKSWKIQDQFPIEVFVEKSWTGKYYVVKVPIMSMSYETFMDLDNFGKVDISTYDYENGEAKFTSYSLDNIKEWGENNKDKIHINYSRLMNEQISRIQSMMGVISEITIPSSATQLIKELPSKLKELFFNQWNAKQNPKWHPEGNTLKHILIVIKRAYHYYPDDPNMIMAALFHDLGKMDTYSINPKTGEPTAYGHEDKSEQYVEEFRDWIQTFDNVNIDEIKYLVKNHMKVKPTTWNVMKDKKKEPIQTHSAFDKLMGFTNNLDGGGIDIEKK